MEKYKHEIIRHIHSKNNMWAAFLVTSSGTLAVMFNLHSMLQLVFFILGIFCSIIFLTIHWAKSRYIDYLIKKLGEENEHI